MRKSDGLCPDARRRGTGRSAGPAESGQVGHFCQSGRSGDNLLVDQELIEHRNVIETYLNAEDCADYRYPMEETFRTIPHHPDAQTEQLLAQMSDLFQNPQKTFKAFVPEFKPVMIDGKEEFLNQAIMNQLLHNPDRETAGRRLSISMKNTAGIRTFSVRP